MSPTMSPTVRAVPLAGPARPSGAAARTRSPPRLSSACIPVIAIGDKGGPHM